MKRLNPLYLILLFLTAVFISFFILNNKNKEIEEKTKEYLTIQQKAKDYKTLKSQWSDKEFVNKTVNQIIKNRKFKKEKILVANVKKVVKVKIESANQKLLDDFLNKILNKPVIIKSLIVTKNSINLELGVK